MKDQIKNYLNKYVKFTDNEIDEICSNLSLEIFPKKTFILKEGQICSCQYFIARGLVRSFYIDNKGNEKIDQFAIENWWLTNMESFINGIPSSSSIQALEETHVYILKKENLEKLYLSIPKLERFFRLITEKILIATQLRNNHYLQKKSNDRYIDLITHFPDFTQRVPQYMIASYLEITPEYLSELRKK